MVKRNALLYKVLIGAAVYMTISAICVFAERDHYDHRKPEIVDSENYFYKDLDTFRPDINAAADIDQDDVGITEKLGRFIPLDTRFADADGNSLKLDNFIDRPTLILPVFYRCPQSCGMLLSNLSDALNNVAMDPGRDYNVISISFDAQESPVDAKEAKKTYLQHLRKDFPVHRWKFLTGDKKNIHALTQALGYKFKKIDDRNFVHPNVLICVAADGKIIRYLHGTYMLPFDISMSIAEAEKGTPGISIKKLASYCFAYDPVGGKYVFKTFRVTGIAILLFLGIFLFFLLRKGNDQS